MAPRANYHHAFPAKVDVAVGVAKSLGWIAGLSRPQLAARLGISPNTLKSACSSHRVSDDLTAAFAEGFGFEVTCPWWFDASQTEGERQLPQRDYAGRDSVTAFHSNLCRLHGLAVPSTRIESRAPELKKPLMAHFALDDAHQSVVAGTPSSIFANIVVRPTTEAGVRYGFSSVMLRIILEPQSKARLSSRLGANPVRIRDATLAREGTDHTPHWHLRVASGMLHGEYLTTLEPLAQLVSAPIGTKFRAELLVNPHDGELVFDGDPAVVSGAKQQILMALMAERLPEATAEDDGWITLGIQELELVRADRTA
jgi:hypothetical protein